MAMESTVFARNSTSSWGFLNRVFNHVLDADLVCRRTAAYRQILAVRQSGNPVPSAQGMGSMNTRATMKLFQLPKGRTVTSVGMEEQIRVITVILPGHVDGHGVPVGGVGVRQPLPSTP